MPIKLFEFLGGALVCCSFYRGLVLGITYSFIFAVILKLTSG